MKAIPEEHFVSEPHETDAQVDWLPTYDYDAKHRKNEENPFECPCAMCGYSPKHRRRKNG